MNREEIISAFYDLLQTVPDIVYFSRRIKKYDEIQPDSKPAICLSAGDQTVQQDPSGLTPIWKIKLSICVYTFSSDVTSTPAIALNNILDAIEYLLVPRDGPPGFPGTVQTLGGLVRYAWISGPIETDEGTLGDNAVAVVPVEIEYV